MTNFLLTISVIFLLIKAIQLTVKLTLKTAKIIATIMISLALAAFVICIIFFGGFLLLIPTGLLIITVAILKIIS